MLKDGPLVFSAKAGRGSLCEQEEEKLLPSVVKCGKSGFTLFQRKINFGIENFLGGDSNSAEEGAFEKKNWKN